MGCFLNHTLQTDVAFLQSWGAYLTIFVFPKIVSLREKTLKNTNLVPSRHFKRVKDSLPVDMHYSKTSLLKLPYNETRTKTRSRRGSRIITDRFLKRAPKAQAFGVPGGMSQ